MRKEIVTGAVSAVAGYTAGRLQNEKKLKKEIERMQKLSDKLNALFLLMNQWVKVKQDGKGVADYLERQGYKKVAIYGMSYAGETLARELHGSDIEVEYGIDREADNIYAEFKVVKPDGQLEKVDAVIVTSITFFDEIANDLCTKIDCPILSLEDILYEI